MTSEVGFASMGELLSQRTPRLTLSQNLARTALERFHKIEAIHAFTVSARRLVLSLLVGRFHKITKIVFAKLLVAEAIHAFYLLCEHSLECKAIPSYRLCERAKRVKQSIKKIHFLKNAESQVDSVDYAESNDSNIFFYRLPQHFFKMLRNDGKDGWIPTKILADFFRNDGIRKFLIGLPRLNFIKSRNDDNGTLFAFYFGFASMGELLRNARHD